MVAVENLVLQERRSHGARPGGMTSGICAPVSPSSASRFAAASLVVEQRPQQGLEVVSRGGLSDIDADALSSAARHTPYHCRPHRRACMTARASSASVGVNRRCTVSNQVSWLTSVSTARCSTPGGQQGGQAMDAPAQCLPSGPSRSVVHAVHAGHHRQYSACAVQMLLVALSRRMCCSRVCRAMRRAGLPWRS